MDKLPAAPSLFDISPNTPASGLHAEFQTWLENRAAQATTPHSARDLNEASVKIYQEMWKAFADYCDTHSIKLESMTTQQIEAFLQFRGRGEGNARMPPKGQRLSPRYAWRMLTLIDHIARLTAERNGKRANRAARDLLERPEYRYANARQRDPLPEYFQESEVQRIIGYLQSTNQPQDGTAVHWKMMRDCAAIALMLGAGLAPGDVRAALLSGVYADGGCTSGIPWKVSLPGNGNTPERETPIAPWAGQLMAKWIARRNEEGIPGDVLFPSTLSGKPLSHATCYKVCKSVLEEIGLDDGDGGIFKLRHTFALRQLADGKSEVEVARWLGLLDLNGMARYRKVVQAPVDLV
jgi:site-specific recombinase XerD